MKEMRRSIAGYTAALTGEGTDQAGQEEKSSETDEFLQIG